MKFMLLIYGDEQAMAHATDEQNQAVAAEYEVFTQSIKGSGNYLDGDPFLPTSTAKTVTAHDGKPETREGPVEKTRQQLFAYYKVEAEGPEQAVEMASRIPGAKYGSIEVRPVMQFD
jgi:hypothetical protein